MDDREATVRIGSRVRGSGTGGGDREAVIKGKGALNAAQRAGAVVATEKKYTTANAADKGNTEGQRLTKVDRSDDVVAPQKMDSKLSEAIKARRAQEGFKLTQAQLAQRVNVPANDIKQLESGSAIKNQALLNKVCRVLKISPRTGEPLPAREEKKK